MGKKETSQKQSFLLLVEENIVLVLFSFIIVILFEILIIALQYRQTLIETVQATELPEELSESSPSAYPIFVTYYEPYVTAESAIVLDNQSKRVMYEKRSDLRFSMASTTKLMTAIVALEYFEFNDILTVKDTFTEGSVVGFNKGEQIYFEDILYALLLKSGNDAAHIIADNYPGGIDAFVTKMNQKVSELKLRNTHFADPAGLDDDQNFSTTKDLAMLSSYALTNPTLARVVNTKEKTFTDVSGKNQYAVYNLNELLGTNGVIGIKTGTTRGAGEVLTTAVEKDGRDYIIVVMKSEDRFADTLRLIDLLDRNVHLYSPQELISR